MTKCSDVLKKDKYVPSFIITFLRNIKFYLKLEGSYVKRREKLKNKIEKEGAQIELVGFNFKFDD